MIWRIGRQDCTCQNEAGGQSPKFKVTEKHHNGAYDLKYLEAGFHLPGKRLKFKVTYMHQQCAHNLKNRRHVLYCTF